MKWWEIIIHLIGIAFCMFAYLKSYSLIFKNTVNWKSVKTIFIFIVVTIISYYNTFYNYDFTKIIISFLELAILFKFVFNDNLKTTFLKSILLYLLGCIIELILGIPMVYFSYNSVVQIDNNLLFKFLFSILMNLFMILVAHLNFIKKVYNKIYDIMNKIFNITLLIVISIALLVLLTYYLIIASDIYSIGSTFILVVSLFLIVLIAIFQSIKTKKEIDKQEILLNFMKEYEIIIDKERVDRHEMVNNLLVLKSIKNKNTKNYNKILDDILLTYQSSKTPSGLYELPSGLKGLFYYKIYDMRSNNIEVFINISNKIFKNLDNLDSKALTKVCKILGILLDNAKEAASESKEKIVIIDLYEEKDCINIYIENSMNEKIKIDLSKIKVKGFSTKGNSRGYGLYIIDKLLENKRNLDLIQEINNKRFVSILKIKK